MTKSILAVTALIFCSTVSFSQCIPDSTIESDYYPTEAEGLPEGRIGIGYSAVIHLNVPKDTTIQSITGTIDSLTLDEVEGLPTGIQYACTPISCSLPGGSVSCIELSGIPTDSNQVGENAVIAKFTFYVTNGPLKFTYPYEITDYKIQVNEPYPVGVMDVYDAKLDLHFDRNPVSASSSLHFELPEPGPYSLEFYSILGSDIYKFQGTGNAGKNVFRMREFQQEAGVYFVRLQQGRSTQSLRFIVR